MESTFEGISGRTSDEIPWKLLTEFYEDFLRISWNNTWRMEVSLTRGNPERIPIWTPAEISWRSPAWITESNNSMSFIFLFLQKLFQGFFRKFLQSFHLILPLKFLQEFCRLACAASETLPEIILEFFLEVRLQNSSVNLQGFL